MKKISIWKDMLDKKINFKNLDSDKSVDVLIIGGGITGISTYYWLKKSNLNIMLVEQNKIGMGVTSNSTGKLSFLQNDLIDKIRNSFDDKTARMYLRTQKEAIHMVVDTINHEKIDCDLKKVDSYLYTNQNSEIEKIKDLEKFLKKSKIKVDKVDTPLVESKYMIGVHDTYMFHPLKFIYSLIKKDDNLYEDTSIIKIKDSINGYLCYTNNHVIKASWVVIASHYPYFNIPFLFPIKGSIETSYISASPSKQHDISLISYSKPFISIRTYQNYLIYLANSHAVNHKASAKENFNELLKKVNDLKLQPEYLWSNNDIITNDGLPYIGEIKHHMLLATGYNTWGLATSFLAGKILFDIILENKNSYIELFNPTRMNVDTFIGGITNAYKSIEGYINGFKKQDNVFYYGKVMEYKGHQVYSKCPHMGCKLNLNEMEETWDCPCHGSRFDIDGNVINGPSNKSIKHNK